MRERAHEVGRTLLLGFLAFMERLSQPGALDVKEIGNAYTTQMRTRAPTKDFDGEVFYDGVLSVRRSRGTEISWMIESKVANQISTQRKLPRHLEAFVVKTYRTLVAWPDAREHHRPLFVFLTNATFQSPLYSDGKLSSKHLESLLKRSGIAKIDSRTIAELESCVKVYIFPNWFREMVG